MRKLTKRSVAGIAIAFLLGTFLVLAPAQSSSAAPTEGKRIGRWSVQNLPGGKWQISWSSPTRLPVTSDRPKIVRNGSPVGVSVVSSRDVVSTVVSSKKAPDTGQLEVMLSGDRISRTGQDVVSVRSSAPNLAPGELLPFDPADPGPYQVVRSDYEGVPVEVDGFDNPVEFVGHVVEPQPGEATGPRPVALFLHGRHIYCYSASGELDFEWLCQGDFKDVPSHLGYDYMQQVLASQGYFTVSIRVNGINAQDYLAADGGAAARAQLVRAHLDYWADRAAGHNLDLSKVVLVGHSRGGEGVARAALQIPLASPYRVVGAVLIAPTDFSGQAVPYVPTVAVLPFCDGDVFDLQGQRFTDVSRDVVKDDNALHSSILVMGANHNYFNTEWTPGSKAPSEDDWFGEDTAACGSADPTRLSAQSQRDVGTAYVAGAVQLFTGKDDRTLALFNGERTRVASTGDAVILGHSIGGGKNLRAPALDTGTTDSTMDSQFCEGRSDPEGGHSICGRGYDYMGMSPHWPFTGEVLPERKALELSWDEPGQVGGLSLDNPLDLTGNTLRLRAIVDPAHDTVRFRVRLTDSSGASVDLDPVGGVELASLSTGDELARLWAQTVVVDPAGAAIDLTSVSSIELVSDSPTGRVWILDAAASPPTLPALQAKRAPLVSLGSMKVAEGDDPNPRTVRVPFTVSGGTPARGAFVVNVSSFNSDQRSDLVTINLASGQTKGFIPVDVTGNTEPAMGDIAGFGLNAWALRGVMTDSWVGVLEVEDDDPPPTINVRVKKGTVKEGGRASWVITLDKPLISDLWVDVQVVRGPKKVRALNGADVPKSWRKAHNVESKKKPLYEQWVWIPAVIPAGSQEFTVSIPIAKDKVKEKREQITLTFSVPVVGFESTKTVYVAASK